MGVGGQVSQGKVQLTSLAMGKGLGSPPSPGWGGWGLTRRTGKHASLPGDNHHHQAQPGNQGTRTWANTHHRGGVGLAGQAWESGPHNVHQMGRNVWAGGTAGRSTHWEYPQYNKFLPNGKAPPNLPGMGLGPTNNNKYNCLG